MSFKTFFVHDQKDLINACWQAAEFMNHNEKFGANVMFKNNLLNVTGMKSGFMIYSKMLRIININSGKISVHKVTLQELTYKD